MKISDFWVHFQGINESLLFTQRKILLANMESTKLMMNVFHKINRCSFFLCNLVSFLEHIQEMKGKTL